MEVINRGTFRIGLVGDCCCGKVSLIERYVYDYFSSVIVIKPTYFANYHKTNQGVIYFKLWDLIESSRRNQPSEREKNDFKKIHGFLLVFDVTNYTSFERLSFWLEKIKENTSEDVPIFIVGNRIDDIKHFVVDKEKANQFSLSNSIPIYYTSAKTGEGVNDVFNDLKNLILKNATDKQITDNINYGIYRRNEINKPSFMKTFKIGLFVSVLAWVVFNFSKRN
ncbi:hypothetical protein ACTFIZ_002651 [Dictyostelium cf. discoideum]